MNGGNDATASLSEERFYDFTLNFPRMAVLG